MKTQKIVSKKQKFRSASRKDYICVDNAVVSVKASEIKQARIELTAVEGKGQTPLRDVIRVGALAFIAKTLAEDISKRKNRFNNDKQILNWLKKHYEVPAGHLATDNIGLILNKYTSLYDAVSEKYKTTTQIQKVIQVLG